MAKSSAPSSVSTFVIRFWQEWSAAGVRWRGHIEHVQSGEGITFLELEKMVEFVHSFGVMAGGKAAPPDDP